MHEAVILRLEDVDVAGTDAIEVCYSHLSLVRAPLSEEDLAGPEDLVVDVPGMDALGDDGAPPLDLLVGQLLAFFRCLSVGLRPDMPSEEGVISRVVEGFAIHRRS